MEFQQKLLMVMTFMFHSISPESLLAHHPGIKVVAPSNPYDAKGLLVAAVNDPNPVMYLEHKKTL